MKQRPNIVLITTDQQRFDSIGINGSSFMNTPNLDRIGSQGARFTRAYCPNAVCTPSRVSMMTGMHLSRHGAYNIGTYVEDSSTFMSQLLRDHGYFTCHIGKAHWNAWGEINDETREVGPKGEPFTDFMGFHQAEFCIGHGHTGTSRSHYAHWLQAKGYDPDMHRFHPAIEDDPMETGDWDLPLAMHSGSWIVERAKDVLEQRTEDQPFFLNLGFPDPHHPHVLPTEFTNRIDENEIPLPSDMAHPTHLIDPVQQLQRGTINASRFAGTFKVAGNGDDADWLQYFADEARTRKTRAYYYSMIQLFDEQVGELLNSLEKLDLLHNTIMIVTSDHGEMLGDHRIGQKGPLLYEGVTHIPLFIHYPEAIEPSVVDECVSLIDLLPTIADYAQLESDVKRDGISLYQRLQQGTPLPRSGVRIEYKEEPDRIRYKCWVTAEWKLGVYLGETFGELYHLASDPGEIRNLFDDSSYEWIKLQLTKELLEDMERSEPVSRRPSRV